MKFLVINGPNMNMLGIREPEVYGAETYDSLCKRIQHHCEEKNIESAFFQSNHEGALVDCIQEALGRFDGIIINAAAYSHTSIAILDALRAVNIPAVEVHITDTKAREEFRHKSIVSGACFTSIIGHGASGYLSAVDVLCDRLGKTAV